MGLDLSHLQLTHTPKNKGDFFTLDDWEEDCNVPLKVYEKYISTIDDYDFNKSLAIVNCDEDLEKLNKSDWFSSMNFLKVFIGEQDAKMKEELSKFIINKKLNSLEYSELGCEHDGTKFQTISFADRIQVQGLYYNDDIGYQRKGMNNLFYDLFGEKLLWGNKEDFELAYTCIGNVNCEQAGIDRMKRNFKEHFIDKFEFGRSLLCIG